MPASLVQSATRVTINNAASKTIAFSGAMTNPSKIILLVDIEGDATISSVSDDRNGSYGAADHSNYSSYGTNHATAAVYSVENAQTSVVTITVNLSAASWGSLWAYEVTGLATSSDVDATGEQDISDATISFNVVTTVDNDAIFSVGSGYPSTGITNDTGFTAASGSPVGINNQYSFAEYDLDVGTAGTKTLTYGSTGNKQGAVAAVAYKLDGGGGGGGGGQPTVKRFGGVPGMAINRGVW